MVLVKGLIIKSPWIELIFQGRKTWEIRGSNTSIRGQIALIKSASGLVLGKVDLIDSRRLTLGELQATEAMHCIPREQCTVAPYDKIHAWVVANPVLFKSPVPYVHPRGAVIWVNLTF
jgi:hypothetical protein